MLEWCLTSSLQSNHGQCWYSPGTMHKSRCLWCSTDFKAALCMPQEIISWSGLKKLGNNQVLNVLSDKTAKSTEHGLGIQSQVSTFLCHSLGSQNAYFFQHDVAWVLLKSSFFVFLCSPSHSTSYSSVLLCSFLQHLHLTLSHFPDDCRVSTV